MAVPPHNSSELVAGRWILPGLCPDSELLLFFFLFVCFGWLAVVVVLVWGSVRQIFIFFFRVCVKSQEGGTSLNCCSSHPGMPGPV